jgi:hypothetical protein
MVIGRSSHAANNRPVSALFPPWNDIGRNGLPLRPIMKDSGLDQRALSAA